MLMRKLGRTGLRVSALCLGGNTFGWTTDQKASETVLDAYLEAGGNFIDTADVYSRWAPGNSGGESEIVLGKWTAARKNRHAALIATKVMGPMGPGANDTGLSRQHIVEGVEDSLRRLQTDYIDLYQAHWDDRETPLEETLRAFDDLVSQGKVRYLGASNYQAWRLTRALWESDKRGYVRYESLQPKYNLVFRDEYERELEPLCLEQTLAVIPYSSLGSGFLSGKYRRGRDLPKTARAGNVQKTYMTDRGFTVLEAVEKVAASVGATPAQVALSWLAHRPGITAPIASATSVTQLKELLGGIELQLDAEARATLDPGERLAGELAPGSASSRDLREDEHFTVGADRLEQGLLVDLAVDGHGHAVLEMGAELRVKLGELLVELLHGRRREIELGDAPRELSEVADQHYPRHLRFSSCRCRRAP